MGKYRLLAVLARGGMGDVYLAVADGMEGFSKLLVVKELRREQGDDDVSVGMFMDEARLTARLNHPNIVQTIEVGSDGERRFLVMEHLDGQPLHRVLRRARRSGRPLSTDLHVRVLADVLEALAYAHTLTEFDGKPLGVVHRDVSPQNVFLTYEGQVKLIDFGIAKTHLASQQTSAGVLKGKIRYMSPEQATGQPIDFHADIFSVGVMLWEALLGHGPWEGQSDMQTLHGLMMGAIPRLQSDRPRELPPGLAAAANRAMCAMPQERYPSARAMRDDLLRDLSSAAVGGSNELREIVSGLFAEERRELGAVIDAQLRAMSAEASLHLVSLTRVRTQTHEGASNRGIEASSPEAGSSASMPSRAEVPAVPASHGPMPDPPPVTRSRSRVVAALVVAAFVVAALVTTVVSAIVRTRWAPPVTAPVVALAVAPKASVANAEPLAPELEASRTVQVTVHALPQAAKLYVDNVLVENPYVAQFARSGAVHALRVEAPEYTAKTRTFTQAENIDVEISLERESVRRRGVRDVPEAAVRPISSSPSVSTEPPPSVRSIDVRAPHVRPQRELDKVNPYAQ
ncbi:MAG: serine/threonine-protein kinase [Polyangiaceae bacterium]